MSGITRSSPPVTRLVQGRKIPVDTTVVETNVHYPTDSSLLGDGARVLTRTMKKVEKQAGKLKRGVRNRMRSVNKRVLAIALSARRKDTEGEERRKREYCGLLRLSRQISNDTQRALDEVDQFAPKRRKELQSLTNDVAGDGGTCQGIRQAKVRVFEGVTTLPEKIVSLFEPHTEIIRKGKGKQPTEIGNLGQLQEAENQIITYYEVFEQRPSDQQLLLPAVNAHQQVLGCVPRLVAADAGFYCQAHERAAQQMGVKWVAVPNRNTRSADRKALQKSRYFKKAQAWRTGCEGRISVIKRRHGLTRCRYKGMERMRRWVGLGVLARNLINIGNTMAVARA